MRDIKRTLWISGFSIFMAVVLLLGTTFAWFTDSVTNHGNKIQSGSLKVDLLMDEDGNDSYISIANQQGNIFSNQAGENGHNWEPGKTQLVYLAVENKESLALKYNVNLEISGELADYLEYTVIDDKKASEITAKNWDEIKGIDGVQPIATMKQGTVKLFEKPLLEPKNKNYFVLAVHMKEEAANEAMGKSVNIDMTVNATQAMSEFDGFGNSNYDEEAPLDFISVSTDEQMKEALKKGGNIIINNNISVTDEGTTGINEIKKPATLNFVNNTLSLDIPNAISSTKNWVGLRVMGGDVVLEGSSGGVTTSPNGELYAIYADNANLVINGGRYVGGTTAVQLSRGSLTIKGGFFEARIKGDDKYNSNPKYLINCIDQYYNNGVASVKIMGGTFVNFNPADNEAEGKGTDFVPEGYRVIESVHGSDTWYTVVRE